MKDKFDMDLKIGDTVLFSILSDLELGIISSNISNSGNIKISYKNNYINNKPVYRIVQPNKVIKVNTKEHLLFEYMLHKK